MSRLKWGEAGQKRYETGLDRGVLYLPNPTTGVYDEAHPWNGLTTVTETPSGAETTKNYADNTVYASVKSAEEFGATVEAFTYPDAFEECDGSRAPVAGVTINQQGRRTFGFAYRTRVGNDLQGDRAGHKLHLIYGADAAPSEKTRATVNESTELAAFSWEVTTTSTNVGEIDGVEYDPCSKITIDSTKVSAEAFAALEDLLYGTEGGGDAGLPLPADVFALFTGGGTLTDVNMVGANAPSYNSGTHVITLPNVTGVQWRIDGEDVASGAQPALEVGETVVVTAHSLEGYEIQGDDDWVYAY